MEIAERTDDWHRKNWRLVAFAAEPNETPETH